MKTPLIAVALGLMMLTMTGCGGSSSGTGSSQASTTAGQASTSHGPSTLTASVEAICARRDSAITSAGIEYSTEKELKHMAQGRAAVEKTTLVELNKLTVPATMEPGWQQFNSDRQDVINKWTTIVKRGLAGGTTDILESTAVAQEKMLAAAKSLGFRQCTQAD